jgi:hypothetical protein
MANKAVADSFYQPQFAGTWQPSLSICARTLR